MGWGKEERENKHYKEGESLPLLILKAKRK